MATRVTAVVLAAGESQRMGVPKLLLPWGETTVLGQTLAHVRQSKVDDCILVSGHQAQEVAAIAAICQVDVVYNPAYAEGEMLSSLQVGLCHLPPDTAAILVVLGDQPLVGPAIMNSLLAAYEAGQGHLIAPTYRGVRGNPVLIGRPYFAELLALPHGDAPRTLLRRHQDELHLVPVDSAVILQDIDRPADYEQHRPPAQEG